MRQIREGFQTVNRDVAIALCYLALVLTALEYFYLPDVVQARLDGADRSFRISLEAGATWAWMTSLLYLLPTAWMLIRGEKLATIGYRFRGVVRHAWIYLALFVFMLPFVWFAARRPEFARTYPFVWEARKDWTEFLLWEVSYLFQFFALEAFFRGYLLFKMEKRFGWNAIFIVVVPYVMIHFHKPVLEASGALVAGIVLGALALRLRSFYGGFILHSLVALTMDLMGVHKAGLF